MVGLPGVVGKVGKNVWSKEVLRSKRIWIMVVVPVLILSLEVVVFTTYNPRFLSWYNVFNLMRQSSVLLLVSIGATFVIQMGSIDLSVGSLVSLVGIISAVLLKDFNLGLWVIPCAIITGLFCGLANGVIFVYGKIPSFLTTLGMMAILEGLCTVITGGHHIHIGNEAIRWMASGCLIWKFPNGGIWALAMYGIGIFVSFRTRFGRCIYAIGAGERAAYFSGISINRYKVQAFVLSGLFCGLAGFLQAARMSSGTVRMGEDLLLESIAAIVMGGTALSGGVGGVQRSIIGVLVIVILSNGLNVVGVHHYLQILIKGLVVIFAVALTLDRSRIEFVK